MNAYPIALPALEEALKKLIGQELGDGESSATELAFDKNPTINFTSSKFVLTGKFAFGPKERVAEEIQKAGGFEMPQLPSELYIQSESEYGNLQAVVLVVGTLASKDWKHGNFGRKVEGAIQLRDQGLPVVIVSEEYLFTVLEEGKFCHQNRSKLFSDAVVYEIDDGINYTKDISVANLKRIIEQQPEAQTTENGELKYVWRRSRNLITSFPGGFAKHWAFPLHGVFSQSLDIRPKKLSKKELKENASPYFVQGSSFNFSEGQIIYNNPKAYTGDWKALVSEGLTGLHIEMGLPVTLDQKTGKRDGGFIIAKVLRGIDGKFQFIGKLSGQQDDLVRWLIIGIPENEMRTIDYDV